MKHYSLLKTIAYSAVFFVAMAFSCQDHHVPDPGPSSNCNRVDGTQRAFPCEFEITKIEFFDVNTSNIAETITNPNQLQGKLLMQQAYRVQPFSGHDYFVVFYHTKVYIKRIANSPSAAWNKYKVMQYRPANHPVAGDNIYFPFPWTNSINGYQEITSWAVGETKTFERDASFEMSRWYIGSELIYSNVQLYCSIVNYNTWEALVAAPHKYELIRDLSEATVQYKMQMGDNGGPNHVSR